MKDFWAFASDEKPPPHSGFEIHYSKSYRRCGMYQGTPANSAASRIDCDKHAIGRYLYLTSGMKNYLMFCEVEAYGLGK